MDAPSMVQRSVGGELIVRSVVSGNQLYLQCNSDNLDIQLVNRSNNSILNVDNNRNTTPTSVDNKTFAGIGSASTTQNLPQCKIKRNYSCNNCTYFTQNPRHFLTHLKDIHGEKIIINECKHCLYASRHYQKLVRHMKMVHGSTDGLEEQAQFRKRASQLAREQKKRKSNFEDLQQHQQNHYHNNNNTIHQPLQLTLPNQQQQQQQQQHHHHPPPQPPPQRQPAVHQQQLHKQLSPQIISSQQQEHIIKQLQQEHQPLSLVHPNLFRNPSTTPSPTDYPNNKLLKCTVCEFSTLFRAQLVDHERVEHNKTKFFRCEKCSYVTHIKARYSKHVKYHSMPMIKCEMCDFRTPYKWNLDRHMKNHGGTGVYKCAACNFTADIKQSLTVHEMNHHVPPVGQASGMSMSRRKNKVGGTDISEPYSPINLLDQNNSNDNLSPTNFGIDYSINNNNNNNNSFDSFNEPLMKKIKIETSNEGGGWYQTTAADLSQKPHTQTSPSSRKASRPVPNLIPIIGNAPTPPPAPSAMNLTMPPKQLLETMNEFYAKSQNNTLKDFASLFVSEEMLASFTERMIGTPQLSPSSNASSSARRKTLNFFEELKEKFVSGNGGNLVCRCGHSSKCLSELIIHQKNCGKQSLSPINLSTGSNSSASGGGGSTRCQYCRHRCKSSADLFVHMQNCLEAKSNATDSMESISDYGSNEKNDISEDVIDENGDEDMLNEPHPMENKVFVWNKMPHSISGDEDGARNDDLMSPEKRSADEDFMHNERSEDSETNEDDKHDESSYYGVETAPGYGEVTKKMNAEDEAVNSSLKKVFKCPHCSFWASTASRFHVHIVGHLNKKPFECSLCAYRSNWRWDITKHIRLKTIRDPTHKTAKVLMNDETGRRNYTKYNKHITLMKVTEEDGDPKLLKSGEMTPSQEAALAFLPSAQKSLQQNNEIIDLERDSPLPLVKTLSSDSLKLIRLPYTSAVNTIPSSSNATSTSTNTNLLLKSNLDLLNLSENKLITGETSEDHKKTSYKCKRCNFRDPVRDVVLAHVRQHYHEAGIIIEDKNSPGHIPNLPPTPLEELIANNPNSKNLMKNFMMGLPYLSNLNIQQQQQQQQTINTHANNITNSFLLQQSFLKNASQTQITATDMSTNTSTTAATVHPIIATSAAITTNDNGEMDEASSLGTSVTGWPDPAPYRCGHCHQVSNWKHVIQRHCRLKHNGDINIELIEKGNKSKTYNRLIIPGSGGSGGNSGGLVSSTVNCSSSSNCGGGSGGNGEGEVCGSNHTNPDVESSCSNTSILESNLNKLNCIPKSPQPSSSTSTSKNGFTCTLCQTNLDNSLAFIEHLQTCSPHWKQVPNSDVQQESSGVASKEQSSLMASNQHKQNQLIELLNRKPKRYQCTACPYVSPCKSQLENHNTFHNNIQVGSFKCKYCSYNVTKKHLLLQHQKMHLNVEQTEDDNVEHVEEEVSGGSNAIDLTAPSTSNALEMSKKLLMFCSYCPARYTNNQELSEHLRMHASWYPYTCSICTYTSPQEAQVLKHSIVHSTEYQEKTDLLLTEFGIHPDYKKPKLYEIYKDSWIVDELRKRSELITIKNNANKNKDLCSTDLEGSDMDLDDMISATKVPNTVYSNTNIDLTEDNETPSESPKVTTMEKQIRKIQEYRNLQQSGSSGSETNNQESKTFDEHKDDDDDGKSIEKCPHCPFSTNKPDILKTHMNNHICVSGEENSKNCDHCDYSVADENVLKDHIKLHFGPLFSHKTNSGKNNVAFFTSYDNLILTSRQAKCSSSPSDDNDDNNMAHQLASATKTIFPPYVDGNNILLMENNSSDKENKIIVDINTGEVFK